MKQFTLRFILFSLLAISSILQLRAENISFNVQNGTWHDPNSWDLGRIPQAGDFVFINKGQTCTVNNHVDNTFELVYIDYDAVLFIMDYRFESTYSSNEGMAKIYNLGYVYNYGDIELINPSSSLSSKQVTGVYNFGYIYNYNKIGAHGEIGIHIQNENYIYNADDIYSIDCSDCTNFINNGDIYNRGRIELYSRNADIINNGTISNYYDLTLYGSSYNYGTINNYEEFSSRFHFENHGTLSNGKDMEFIRSNVGLILDNSSGSASLTNHGKLIFSENDIDIQSIGNTTLINEERGKVVSEAPVDGHIINRGYINFRKGRDNTCTIDNHHLIADGFGRLNMSNVNNYGVVIDPHYGSLNPNSSYKNFLKMGYKNILKTTNVITYGSYDISNNVFTTSHIPLTDDEFRFDFTTEIHGDYVTVKIYPYSPSSLSESNPIEMTAEYQVAPRSINVNFTQEWESENVNLSLYDLSGRLILTDARSWNSSMEITTPQMQSGIYLLKIVGDQNEVLTEKVYLH